MMLLLVISIPSYADDFKSWRAFPNSKFNGEVKTIVEYDGNIIAGGKFTGVSGKQAIGIAWWNGTQWIALNNDPDCEVYALTIWDGDLIAGGKFNTIGGVSAKNIARYRNGNWEAMGNGLNNEVNALTVYNDKLVAGGKFTFSGINLILRVGSFSNLSGGTWSQIGQGFFNDVNALTVRNNKLYAGGNFFGHIAELEGNDWKTAGDGLNDEVYALTVHNNRVIAGGKFSGRIAQLQGNDWNVIGNGVNSPVYSLLSLGNELLVGGDFIRAGNTSSGKYVNRIVSWTGSQWKPLSSGMSGRVQALFYSNENLYAGGNFYSAGGDTAYNFSSWKTIPFRTISGKVTYFDNNEPVSGGRVYAAKLDIYTKKLIYLDSADISNDRTNNGEYFLTHVPLGEGDILISFPEDEDDRPRGTTITFLPTYYPNTTKWINAGRLPVNTNLSNINIMVQRVLRDVDNSGDEGSLSGVADINYTPEGYPTSGDFYFNAGTIVYVSKDGAPFDFGVSGEDEKFRIEDLPYGNYVVTSDRVGFESFTANVIIFPGVNTINFSIDTISVITNISGNQTEIPDRYTLHQNYPNPFNPATTIRFSIPTSTVVKLKIYDMLGREVYSLVDGNMTAGNYEAKWNASSFPSGVYYYSLQADGFSQTNKMVLVK
jgi:hypothetical protein